MEKFISEYDKNGNQIFYKSTISDWWWKKEYDERGNCIYSEDSVGFWVRKEFDAQGNETRYQNYLGIDTNKC